MANRSYAIWPYALLKQKCIGSRYQNASFLAFQKISKTLNDQVFFSDVVDVTEYGDVTEKCDITKIQTR